MDGIKKKIYIYIYILKKKKEREEETLKEAQPAS